MRDYWKVSSKPLPLRASAFPKKGDARADLAVDLARVVSRIFVGSVYVRKCRPALYISDGKRFYARSNTPTWRRSTSQALITGA